MLRLPKEQTDDDIGFLIYNLARLQHHSREMANVPGWFRRAACFFFIFFFRATVEIQKMKSRTPGGSALAFIGDGDFM